MRKKIFLPIMAISMIVLIIVCQNMALEKNEEPLGESTISDESIVIEETEQTTVGKSDEKATIETIESETVFSENYETENTIQVQLASNTMQDPFINVAASTIVDVSTLNETQLQNEFYGREIDEELLKRIAGVSYHENKNITFADLKYLRMLYKDLDGNTHVGEMIVNKEIETDVLEIFYQLYLADYPIERMVLIDDYAGDDTLSMEANNTSCFNYRNVSGSTHLSKHALGKAIDLNPQYNPYVTKKNGKPYVSPENGTVYADRNYENPYKIDKNDLAFQLFTQHGFFWGGNWKTMKDYQHFQKN